MHQVELEVGAEEGGSLPKFKLNIDTILCEVPFAQRTFMKNGLRLLDDHLRNHGFLYAGSAGWRLSPIYDLEPTPEHEKARVLHTFIDLDDGTASLELAYSVVEEFGLALKDAKAIAKDVATATKTLDKDAAQLGAGKDEIELMRSAFDHDDLQLGLKG